MDVKAPFFISTEYDSFEQYIKKLTLWKKKIARNRNTFTGYRNGLKISSVLSTI